MHTHKTDRRTFLGKGAAGAVWIASLQQFAVRQAAAGPIGLPLIQLPGGFSYWTYSWSGQTMSDGVACPNLHDGMHPE
jgi:hypothetical protein